MGGSVISSPTKKDVTKVKYCFTYKRAIANPNEENLQKNDKNISYK
jgi:hypothetical protein